MLLPFSVAAVPISSCGDGGPCSVESQLPDSNAMSTSLVLPAKGSIMSKEEAIRVALMYARDRGFVGPDEVEAVAVEREAYWFVGIDQIQPAMIGGDVGVKLLKDGTALTVTFGR